MNASLICCMFPDRYPRDHDWHLEDKRKTPALSVHFLTLNIQLAMSMISSWFLF